MNQHKPLLVAICADAIGSGSTAACAALDDLCEENSMERCSLWVVSAGRLCMAWRKRHMPRKVSAYMMRAWFLASPFEPQNRLPNLWSSAYTIGDHIFTSPLADHYAMGEIAADWLVTGEGPVDWLVALRAAEHFGLGSEIGSVDMALVEEFARGRCPKPARDYLKCRPLTVIA